MPKSQSKQPIIKKPKRKAVLIRLWKYVYKYKWMVLVAVVLTVISNLLALVGPMLSGTAVDAIGTKNGGADFEKVYFYCLLMIMFYAISSLLSYILSVLMIKLSRKIVYKMRKDVFESLSGLPVGFFDLHQAGDIISRISYDIDVVNASLSNDLLQICTSVITVMGSLVMMIMLSVELVLVFVVTIPVSMLITKYMTGKVRPLFKNRSLKLGELNGYTEEIIPGQKVIKAYNQEETFINRFDIKNEEAVEAYYKADYYGSMTGPSVNFINNLSLTLISIFGAILYLFNHLTLGNLSAFVLYSRKFSGPINETANIISELQSAMAAAERVFRLIDEPAEIEDIKDALELIDVKGDVEMKNVVFGYDPNKIIINNLNLEAQRGSVVAIVGSTGSGKTTIINLLMRFYDPQSGVVNLDGYDIKTLTRKSLRLSYAMVLQDTWLFGGSIFDNISYGKPDATMEDVIKVAKAAKIHSYIETLPDGYNTILNEEGINISQGQKQLMTIARAMLLDAKALILDEATSNVDMRTEVVIQKAMQKLMCGKTCFVIAHRLSTIQNADVILVVDKGMILEQGTHDELIKRDGFYSRLYRSGHE